MTYLDSIVAWHRRRAASDDRDLHALKRTALERLDGRPRRPFLAALQEGSRLSVIAEIKRRSPSKGDIRVELDPSSLARQYSVGGAACLSVLTDEPHFGALAGDLAAARDATQLPVLRKDFTVDERDVVDASLMGADAVLIIVAALSNDEMRRFVALASELRLASLVEVHDEDELSRALDVGATLVGVNQRDLKSFEVDTRRAERLANLMPRHVVAVAESGIVGASDARRCAEAGYRAVLVGEHLVRSADPVAALDELRVALPS